MRAQIDDDSDEIRLESGFGIDNVNKRVKLLYGRQYGLSIESAHQVGTRVTLVIPAITGEAVERNPTAGERNHPLSAGALAV